MYGHRQILSCLGIVVLVALLNFYKSAIKRDREQRHYAAQNRRERLEQQLDLEQQQLQLAHDRHVRFLGRWLEYGDRCWAEHALVLRPDAPNDAAADDDDRRRVCAGAGVLPAPIAGDEPLRPSPIDAAAAAAATAATPATATATTTAATESSSGIVYVAVFILLVSLGKAAYDLSKQFKEVGWLVGWSAQSHAQSHAFASVRTRLITRVHSLCVPC